MIKVLADFNALTIDKSRVQIRSNQPEEVKPGIRVLLHELGSFEVEGVIEVSHLENGTEIWYGVIDWDTYRDLSNVFGLPDAETLRCELFSYDYISGNLRLRIKRGPKVLCWLTFSAVSYFDGPTYWKSAAFQLASEEELHTLKYQIGGDPNIGSKKLFVVFTNREHMNGEVVTIKIRILGRGGEISYEGLEFLSSPDESP